MIIPHYAGSIDQTQFLLGQVVIREIQHFIADKYNGSQLTCKNNETNIYMCLTTHFTTEIKGAEIKRGSCRFGRGTKTNTITIFERGEGI